MRPLLHFQRIYQGTNCQRKVIVCAVPTNSNSCSSYGPYDTAVCSVLNDCQADVQQTDRIEHIRSEIESFLLEYECR